MNKRNILASCVVGLTVLTLAGCGTATRTATSNAASTGGPNTSSTGASNEMSTTAKPTLSAKINIVAAEDFWGEVAQAVGGNDVHVTSILNNPNTDPHEYEPTPAASEAVSNAQVVIYTGIGYDDWMSKLVDANSSANEKTVVSVGSDLLGKRPGDNPHIWYIPATVPTLANAIAQDLSKIDPAHAHAYQERAQAYVASLKPLRALIERLKQPSTANIDVSEPVFDYMAAALNMSVGDHHFAKAIEDQNDPSPSDVANLQNDIASKKIRFFVENVQNETPTIANLVSLAERNHIPVVKVTETEPAGKDYVKWMAEQLQQVGTALGH